MQSILLAAAIFLLSLTQATGVSALQEIRFERGQSDHDVRMAFKLEVLQAAMEKTLAAYGPYTISTDAPALNTLRARSALQTGKLLNVYIALTDDEWEQQAIPIRIPVRRGVLNYRLLLAHKDDLPLLAEVRTLEDLKLLQGGSLHSWTTTRILESAGLEVIPANTYEGLFTMLDRHRFSYLVRGVHEIFDEYSHYKDTLPNIAIEPHLLLYIPAPSYVFVSPTEPLLAKRLTVGLEEMVADGTLKHIVDRYYHWAIEQARLHHRRRIVIPNPLLPKATPLTRTELWFDPFKEP